MIIQSGKFRKFGFIAIHNDEQEEIERKLAALVRENFLGVGSLLGFATEMVEEEINRVDIVSMLKNIREGISTAYRNELMATREKMKAERAERAS